MGCLCSKAEELQNVASGYEPLSRGEVVTSQPRQISNEEPWCLDENSFDSWFNDNHIHGLRDFKRDCGQGVDKIVRYLHRVCSSDDLLFNTDKVVKVGQ